MNLFKSESHICYRDSFFIYTKMSLVPDDNLFEFLMIYLLARKVIPYFSSWW